MFGGTVFLASPTGPLPHTEQRFSLQRREARPSRFLPKERCSLVTHEEAKKNFYLEELKLFLVKGSVGRPHARTASPRVRSLRVPARKRFISQIGENDKACFYVFVPTFGAQTTYDCQKDQQDKTHTQKCSRVLLSTIVLLACVTKKNRLKAVQVFLKFSGMASNENKKKF